MAERQSGKEDQEEFERTRREVVQLLRSILEEVTTQAKTQQASLDEERTLNRALVPQAQPLSPEAQAAVDLYVQMQQRIELTCSSVIS